MPKRKRTPEDYASDVVAAIERYANSVGYSGDVVEDLYDAYDISSDLSVVQLMLLEVLGKRI